MPKKIVFFMLLASALHSVAASAEEFVKTDRYTLSTLGAHDDQKAPLKTVVTLSFGADTRTLGEAITEVLNGSGYRWETHVDDTSLNTLPLPSVVRTLGPLRLDEALSTLAGQAWTLHVDELHRTLWFDLNREAFSADQ
jgi:conjugative transfer region protein (TIGR03748 family)